VLPAHNEVGLLGATVTTLVTGLEERGLSFEIIVVENGSSDGTLRLARTLAAQLEQVRVLSIPVSDYGAALATGFAAARGDLVASFDVDYYDLGFLDAARALLMDGQADLVLASKRAPGAEDRRPLLRRLLTAGFTRALRLGLGLKVSDAHGMKVFSAPGLAPVLAKCEMRGSLFDVEIALRAAEAGLRIAELPAQVIERRPARTPLLGRVLESATGIITLRRRLSFERRALAPQPRLRKPTERALSFGRRGQQRYGGRRRGPIPPTPRSWRSPWRQRQ
jgi:glycosyltransferase involved in cell wall biosynthesis